MNKRIKNRLLSITGLLLFCSFGVYLITSSLEDNIVFFYTPSEMEKIKTAKTKIRVGGIIEEDSIIALAPNKIKFVITDYQNSLTIEYSGILPALFRAKQGIVAEGKLVGNVFVATTLLAKHDENYMPLELKHIASPASSSIKN